MGFGSILGKIAKKAVGFIPGVGPIAQSAIEGVTGVLGGAAQAGAANNQGQDALRVALSGQQLARDKFAADVPGQRMTTAIRAALAKNAAPSSVQWGGPGSGLRGEIPQFSGGRKSIYGAVKEPEVGGLMEQVLKDQLLAQQQGGHSGGRMDMPPPPEIGKTSMLDKIIGGGALGGSILSAIIKRNRQGGGDSDFSGPLEEDA